MWTIENMEIMPDYIHIFIKSTPSDSISHIVPQLKGYTSFVLRNEFETIRKKNYLHCRQDLFTLKQ